MNNKITFEAEKEFKRLTGTYSDDFFLILVEFTHKLNNSKSKLVASQAPNILRGLNTFVSNFESLYPLLKAAFPGQLTLSPEDFHDQLIIQYTLKEAHQCHQLMKNIKDAIPDDVEVQRFVSDIFKQRRYDISLHQFLIKIGKRIIDEMRSKDAKLNNAVVAKVNEHNQTIEQLILDHNDTIKRKNEEINKMETIIKQMTADNVKKEEEADKLKQKVNEKDKIIKKKEEEADDLKQKFDDKTNIIKKKEEEADELKQKVNEKDKIIIKKEKAGDELRRQKDDEIDALKNTVDNLEKIVEKGIKKEKAGDELRRQKDDEMDGTLKR